MATSDLIAQREAAGVCIDCGKPFDGSERIGAGSGDGAKFVHLLCWEKRRAVWLGVHTYDDMDGESLARLALNKLEECQC